MVCSTVINIAVLNEVFIVDQWHDGKASFDGTPQRPGELTRLAVSQPARVAVLGSL